MDVEERLALITRNTDEVLTPEDLKWMLTQGIPLRHYIGFEISGFVHLGTGLVTGSKIADFQKAGAKCSCYLATWHAWINNKLDGKLETIRKSAEYFKEGLKAAVLAMGGDPENVKFVSGDELYHNNDDFWLNTIDIAKHMTLSRAMRATTIMGRQAGMEIPLAWLIYTPMQVSDIFAMDINLAHAGLDQRKAQVVAREVAEKLTIKRLEHKGKPYKPVAVHNHLILGLQKPPIWPAPKENLAELWSTLKMSKSVGGSAIFVHDTPEEIRAKIKNAFCPEGETDFNPLLDWAKHLVFIRDSAKLEVKRTPEHGGKISFTNIEDLKHAFAKKELHPLDLKAAMAEAIIDLLEPCRKHFSKGKPKKLLEEMQLTMAKVKPKT